MHTCTRARARPPARPPTPPRGSARRSPAPAATRRPERPSESELKTVAVGPDELPTTSTGKFIRSGRARAERLDARDLARVELAEAATVVQRVDCRGSLGRGRHGAAPGPVGQVQLRQIAWRLLTTRGGWNLMWCVRSALFLKILEVDFLS